ncbi:hypothetical protein ACFLY2_03420 [Patescibacteria group bacterium]
MSQKMLQNRPDIPVDDLFSNAEGIIVGYLNENLFYSFFDLWYSVHPSANNTLYIQIPTNSEPSDICYEEGCSKVLIISYDKKIFEEILLENFNNGILKSLSKRFYLVKHN